MIDSLSNLSVRIPEFLQKGETADLTCSYNLGGDTLYSVKWYKGRHEFYRYMPHELPQIKTFPVKGMKINVSTVTSGNLGSLPEALSFPFCHWGICTGRGV